MKKILFLLLTSILIVSCGEPTINGKIIDNFDKPIEGVNIKIEGTSLTSKSNSNGEYSIEFVPGNDIKLSFKKENYTNSELKVNIATKTDYPAEIVKTYRVPKNIGINYIDENDYKILPKSEISINKSEFWDTAFGSNSAFDKKEYYATLDKKKIPIFEGSIFLFSDTSPDAIGLAKLGDDLKIASISYPVYSYYYRNKITISNYKPYRKIRIKDIKTKYTSLRKKNNGKSFGIREYKNLKKGFYAFYVSSNSGKEAISSNYCFLFQIK